MRFTFVLLAVVASLLSSTGCAKSLRQDSPDKIEESAKNEERWFKLGGKVTAEAAPIKSSKWNDAFAKVLKFILPHPEGRLVYKGNGQWRFKPN
ncbi:hypothetical protein PPTG_24629 [Phytophthora nicotianae INRA-310]|uniref:RxLR effector protein n=1 Tax=Phytophthora nicotianae (strain INRA-310) TaxID=761204 RepID=W2PC46_PHYN3|nr:hypothetical protein PPTG_24629 [Phytophthora nicotianae INRA-310]ETM98406.1 hypothetical protein PPTG_24629 [Phytophthora nicotianae INRA-310]